MDGVVSVADPDAPRRRPGGAEQPIGDIDEFVATEDRFRDAVIEAFRPDGRLIASVRFDSVRELRFPMRGNIWNSPTQDLMSIVIWEAVLTGPR